MSVLVTGASGLVGGAVYNYFKKEGYNVIGTHMSNPRANTNYLNFLDLNDQKNYYALSRNPSIIIHCAALTNVDYCEIQSDESRSVNFVGTKNLVDYANRIAAKFVFISSDYVFDGKSGPYGENDNTNPINVYGKHKLLSEEYILKFVRDCIIIRVTNVYGDEINNKNFISRILNCISKNEILDYKIPVDQFATPINALDIAKCLQILINNKVSGLFHLSSTDYFSRFQLVRRVLDYFPDYKNNRIMPVLTENLNQNAKRPLLGGLHARKFVSSNPNFKFSNVDDYIKIYNGVKQYQ